MPQSAVWARCSQGERPCKILPGPSVHPVETGIADAPHFRHQRNISALFCRAPAKHFGLFLIRGNVILFRPHLQECNIDNRFCMGGNVNADGEKLQDTYHKNDARASKAKRAAKSRK
jgi:hypothetical protein